MSKKPDYHVVPNSGRGGWDVVREGADRARVAPTSTERPRQWSGVASLLVPPG